MKPAAAVVSARRAGTTVTFDQLNKYFTIQEMPVVSSRYWNMIHGANAEQARQDAEGLYTMRVLGRNMAYMLRCKEVARKVGVELPEQETPVFTNLVLVNQCVDIDSKHYQLVVTNILYTMPITVPANCA